MRRGLQLARRQSAAGCLVQEQSAHLQVSCGHVLIGHVVSLSPIPFHSPFDSYDTRGAHAGTPSHWRDEEVLEDRAVFRTHKEPAELIINPVKVRTQS